MISERQIEEKKHLINYNSLLKKYNLLDINYRLLRSVFA